MTVIALFGPLRIPRFLLFIILLSFHNVAFGVLVELLVRTVARQAKGSQHFSRQFV